MRRAARAVTATIVAATLLAGCGDTRLGYDQCQKVAAVAVHDKTGWSDFTKANALERKANNDWPKVFGTEAFAFVSQEVDAGKAPTGFNVVYQNDFIVRRRQTGKLVATVANLSLRTHGFASDRFWSCLYDWPSLYELFITPRLGNS